MPNNGDYTQGAVGAFFCNDHTHFEAAGATRIAETVAKALREQGIGLASSCASQELPAAPDTADSSSECPQTRENVYSRQSETGQGQVDVNIQQSQGLRLEGLLTETVDPLS
ncbi:hypothetical protein [Saccharothrix sp. NRRL B-16314]|uniref:hypothetical protein n=1 Tax=Saccharothrix sp. NRRL B-16314 TaxID=1463825 RepID=UPI001E2DDDE3|nr:hypothetical protein [Saccharothrix sp. NRRL B-16314]